MKKSKHIDEAPANVASANILPDENVKGNYEQLVASSKTNKEKRSKVNKQDTIIVVVDKNPRREGTWGWKSYNIILNHNSDQDLTVEKYLELGGRMNDLLWDVKKDRLQLQSGGA